MTMRGRKTNHRVNEPIKIDFSDAVPENGAANTQGMMRNLVRGAAPKWGTALNKYDNVQNLLAHTTNFQPDEVGSHTVIMVYLDKAPDGTWRFVQLRTEEVRVGP